MSAKKKYDEDVKKYTKKQLKACHDEALTYYVDNKGEVSVKVLSRIGKVPQSYIRGWMKEENWEAYVKEDPGDKVNLSPKTKEFIESAAEKYGLTEQEELFCYHYLKTLNATTAAIRAGYTSAYCYNLGYKLLKKDNVKEFLRDTKAAMMEELFLDQMDIVKLWARIAMADMTEFVKFGPNGVVLRNSNSVDGQLITKVREGKDGVSIELVDKMKAMDRISSYLGILPSDQADRVKLDILKKASNDNPDSNITIEIVGV